MQALVCGKCYFEGRDYLNFKDAGVTSSGSPKIHCNTCGYEGEALTMSMSSDSVRIHYARFPDSPSAIAQAEYDKERKEEKRKRLTPML